MKQIAVYCGSNLGEDPNYLAGAKALGKAMAEKEITLVYGGGAIGLMGAVADSVLEHGGKVIGVIPTFLKEMEVAHEGVTELIVTPDMVTRKAKMMELSDGFIAMPGGIGTLEELFEVLSASQLKLHHKPTGLLNISGFYDPLVTCIKSIIAQKFMPESNLSLFDSDADPEILLTKMANYAPHFTSKWQDPSYLKK
ncbi:TIGR00730 family Rossman fold protein [Ignatzschineria sp. RMDPL8A]|uniref:LOG family protein n=1 Tax=Ignatzschineria sp. RMDPL8A TaxID=2999236 RepID=UPI002446618E|nr:TIGR00730 family Rossman fold protein [Ignatzschineria sp. RMDPL8A]MDG9730445.1 TIGR00730 family Rossman fold protein [Ignatzschineria sp. RMDPL8A]